LDTPEKLRETIERGITSNLDFKDPRNDFLLERLWISLFEATSALRHVTSKISPDKLPDKEFDCLLVLTNCIVDAHASHQSLRAGFHRAAAITSRGMLENMALAVAIKGDETDDVFRQYMAGEYNIPKAVTPATKFFKEIGVIYGVLSSKFAHEPHESIGRAFIQDGNTTTLLLVPPIGRNEFLVQYVLGLHLAMLSSTLGHVIEWTFANSVNPVVYWEKVKAGELLSKKNLSTKAILELSAKVEELVKDKTPEHPPKNKPGSGCDS